MGITSIRYSITHSLGVIHSAYSYVGSNALSIHTRYWVSYSSESYISNGYKHHEMCTISTKQELGLEIVACLGLAGAEARNSASSTPSSSLYSNHVYYQH